VNHPRPVNPKEIRGIRVRVNDPRPVNPKEIREIRVA